MREIFRFRNQLNPLFRNRKFASLAYDFTLMKPPILNPFRFATAFSSCAAPLCETLEEKACINDALEYPKNSADVFRSWGCTDADILKMYTRCPSLRNDIDLFNLKFKLNLLRGLGLTCSDLVKIVNCRPRFLSSRINRCLDGRLAYLEELFGSRETLLKAIVRNPSLLMYDFHQAIKPVVDKYYEMGLSREDLILMLLSRPTLIPRTSFSDEKLEYIRRTGVLKDSKMYKYVVALFAISRLETIRAKVLNFEKFGFSEDEVLQLFGRSPLILTLSIDKVQRNMTYALSMMRQPATMVLDHPFLLLVNLEAVLKPRFVLAGKIQDMDLEPQIKGPIMLTALRMKEKRFIKVFIECHPPDVADELMKFYTSAKKVKRLAQSSKKTVHKGFPF